MKKVYHTTVCIIPPEGSPEFKVLMETRYALRDRGYHRWPPHINLLYPFIENVNFDTLVSPLSNSISKIQPFDIELSELRVFGGRSRGVLWLKPNIRNGDENILDHLQMQLQNEVPICTEQRKADDRKFCAHLTLTHFRTEFEVLSHLQLTSILLTYTNARAHTHIFSLSLFLWFSISLCLSISLSLSVH